MQIHFNKCYQAIIHYFDGTRLEVPLDPTIHVGFNMVIAAITVAVGEAGLVGIMQIDFP